MQEKHTPSVCILVLSWDRKDLAIQCAESLLKSDYPDFKVIVIDNGSIDGTKEAVEEHFGGRVEVLRTPVNLGYSGGFNLGLSYAFEKHAFDYVMVINNDTEIAPDAVSALVKTAESDPKIAFVTGKVYDWKVRDMLQTCGKLEHPIRWNGAHVGRGEIDRGQYDRVEERVFIDDVYMLVKKEIYDQIGGYSTEFHIQAEEYDWQARAKKLGYKACFTPYAKLWHMESTTIGKRSPKQVFYNARNSMLVILLHRDPVYFRRYFWWTFRNSIFSSLRFLSRRQFANATRPIAAIVSALFWAIKRKKLRWKHLLPV